MVRTRKDKKRDVLIEDSKRLENSDRFLTQEIVPISSAKVEVVLHKFINAVAGQMQTPGAFKRYLERYDYMKEIFGALEVIVSYARIITAVESLESRDDLYHAVEIDKVLGSVDELVELIDNAITLVVTVYYAANMKSFKPSQIPGFYELNTDRQIYIEYSKEKGEELELGISGRIYQMFVTAKPANNKQKGNGTKRLKRKKKRK